MTKNLILAIAALALGFAAYKTVPNIIKAKEIAPVSVSKSCGCSGQKESCGKKDCARQNGGACNCGK